jgi:GT2 family glycosyltransferase
VREPSVFIVVLNWNGLADTLECVRSLDAIEYQNRTVVVVDNGSANAEADQLEAARPGLIVLRSRDNLGYAGGNNLGIRLALERGADYVWLLNNDTIVSPGCVTELVATGERDPQAGILSPVVYEYGDEERIQFSGTVLDRAREQQHTLRSLTELDAASRLGPVLLWGTALFLKRRTAETVGLLDERYFAYHEDVDYCLRVIAAGLHPLIVPSAKVSHKSGRSLGSERSPVREYLMVRNWYLLWSSHLTGWQRRSYPRRYLAWALNRVLDAGREGHVALAEHALDGIWDGLRGHWGSWQGKGRMPGVLRIFVTRCLLAWHPYFWLLLLSGNGNVKRTVAKRFGWRRASPDETP